MVDSHYYALLSLIVSVNFSYLLERNKIIFTVIATLKNWVSAQQIASLLHLTVKSKSFTYRYVGISACGSLYTKNRNLIYNVE